MKGRRRQLGSGGNTLPWQRNRFSTSACGAFSTDQKSRKFPGACGGRPGSGGGGHLSSLALLVGTFGPVTTSLSPIVGTSVGSIRFTCVQDLSGAIGQPAMSFHTSNSNVTSLSWLPLNGFAHGPASLTSSTARPGGALQLVTVSKAYTTLSFSDMPLFAIMNLQFVPEPGTLLLLGLGVVGLAQCGRRKRGS